MIDGAEVLSLKTFTRLKALHLSTEDRVSILIAAHISLKRRLQKALRSADEESVYMTFWRRLTHISLPPVSEEDIQKVCTDLHIQDPEVARLAQQHWTNYGTMRQDLRMAQRAGISWKNMTATDFHFLKSM